MCEQWSWRSSCPLPQRCLWYLADRSWWYAYRSIEIWTSCDLLLAKVRALDIKMGFSMPAGHVLEA